MATVPNPDLSYDVQEQRARIDKLLTDIENGLIERQKVVADTRKVEQDTRFQPWTIAITALGAGAALLAAGAALAKLLMS